jgi:hypothetical protein
MRTYFNSPKALLFLTFLFLLLVAARLAAADPIPLRWDANPEPEITGYIVHVGTQSGAYTQHIDVGLATAFVYMGAIAGQRNCFAVTAYMADAIESPISNEVCGYSDTPPTLVNPGAQQSTISQATTLQLQGSDAEGQPLTYGASGMPPGLELAVSTGFISGTSVTAGSYEVTATVFDEVLTASQTFTWTIVASDTTAPFVTITGPTSAATYTTATSAMTLSGTGSDDVGVTQVTWVSDRGGSGTAAGTTSWTSGVMTLQSGQNVITITARDAGDNSATDVVTITYTVSPNVQPALAAVINQSTAIGQVVTLQLVGTDPDGNALTYSATGLPQGLVLVPATGVISGTPGVTGVATVTATVSDGALSASRTFTWAITTDTTSPTVTITGPTTAAAYSTTMTSVVVTGTAGDALGVTQVSWANSRGGSGTAVGTTNWATAVIALQSGPNVVTVTARDGAGNSSTDVLTISATAPTVAITAPTSAGTYLTSATTVTIRGTAADDNRVTRVTWVNDRGGSGTANGTTDWSMGTVALKAGVNVFTVTARDSVGNTARAMLTVTRNVAPTLASVNNRTSRIGQTVSLQLVADDVNGDVLTYSAMNLPPGLSLAPSTGLSTGSPTTLGKQSVTVIVSDGTLSESRSFTWTIISAL